MAHVTSEQLNRLLDQALLQGDHDALAGRLDALAREYESGEMSRAAVLVLAAEQWRLAGRPEIALERYQQAAEDGGDVVIDPRAGIADTLFELGRADEARRALAELWDEGGWTPDTALAVAETLVAYGDLPAAHEWATAGVRACQGPTATRDALLRLRYRIRVDLGMPEDQLDAMLDSAG